VPVRVLDVIVIVHRVGVHMRLTVVRVLVGMRGLMSVFVGHVAPIAS
jgi:hypothetical protein